MGLLSEIKKRQEEKRCEDALSLMNPYVLIPLDGKISWMQWEIIPQSEAAGIFPET